MRMGEPCSTLTIAPYHTWYVSYHTYHRDEYRRESGAASAGAAALIINHRGVLCLTCIGVNMRPVRLSKVLIRNGQVSLILEDTSSATYAASWSSM